MRGVEREEGKSREFKMRENNSSIGWTKELKIRRRQKVVMTPPLLLLISPLLKSSLSDH